MSIKLPRLILKKGEGRRVERGHLWVFSNEVACLEDSDGDEVAVIAADGKFIGSALLSPSALIRARIYARKSERLDSTLIKDRLGAALDFRRHHGLDEEAYRLCNSEGDMLPGLIVDVYRDWAVVQITTAGMDARRELIVSALSGCLNPEGIFERNDIPARRLEGLEERKGLLFGSKPPEVIEITNLEHFLVDIEYGQKTGHFLDFRFHRRKLAALAKGRRVLELCCNTGAFAVSAARAGAESVLAVDSSESALALARKGAEKADINVKCEFERGDAFEIARRLHSEERSFDLILVDPPPFARSRKDLKKALRAYRDLNMRAMRLLAPGGILGTATCSHCVNRADFMLTLTLAARDAHVDFRVLWEGGQAADHTIHHATPESAYLKFVALEKM